MAIYDCFSYFNEDTILDIRLNTLNEHVDRFVIVEGTRDQTGKKKKLNFNINNFKKFKKKIIYIIVEDIPRIVKFFKKNWHPNHARDQFQRNCISRGLLDANDNDLILISDLDEIPNLFNLKNSLEKSKIVFFRQKYFRYKLNLSIVCNQDEQIVYNSKYTECIGTVGALKKNFKTPQYLRDLRNKAEKYIFRKKKKFFSSQFFLFRPHIIENGGWHFAYMNTPKLIVHKIKSFAHAELATKSNTNINFIKFRINNYIDPLDPSHKLERIKLDNSFPDYIIKNKKKFKNWID
jgi:beta-1,4-mannosyl-glycoprotein beta-1,4-N-acetylglucosaminyltransferase